jgi:hypothetical protein
MPLILGRDGLVDPAGAEETALGIAIHGNFSGYHAFPAAPRAARISAAAVWPLRIE